MTKLSRNIYIITSLSILAVLLCANASTSQTIYLSDNFEDGDASDWVGGYYSGEINLSHKVSGTPFVEAEVDAAKSGKYGLRFTKKKQVGSSTVVSSPKFGPLNDTFQIEFDVAPDDYNHIIWFGESAPFETNNESKIVRFGIGFDNGIVSLRNSTYSKLGKYEENEFYHVTLVAYPQRNKFDVKISGNLRDQNDRRQSEFSMTELNFERSMTGSGITRINILTGSRVPPSVTMALDNVKISEVSSVPVPVGEISARYADLTGDNKKDIYLSNGIIWLQTNEEHWPGRSTVLSAGGILGKTSVLNKLSQELRTPEVKNASGTYIAYSASKFNEVKVTNKSSDKYVATKFDYILHPLDENAIPIVTNRPLHACYTIVIPYQAEYALIQSVFTNISDETINIRNNPGWIHRGLSIAHIQAPNTDRVYLNGSGAIKHSKWRTYSGYSKTKPFAVYHRSGTDYSVTNGPVGSVPIQFFAHTKPEDGYSWQMDGLSLSPNQSASYTHMVAFHSGSEAKAEQIYTDAMNNTGLIGKVNSVLQINVSEPDKPDLAITSVSAPNEIHCGQKISVTISLRNQGSFKSGGFKVDIMLSKDKVISGSDTLLYSYDETAQLSPSTWVEVTKRFTIPSNTKTGNYYIGVIVDTKNWVKESNENNNSGYDPSRINILPAIVENNPPVAKISHHETKQDTSVTVRLVGSDSDGDKLTYKIISQPKNGKLSGSIPYLIYTPNNNFYGSDEFTFIVNDGKVNSKAATVYIEVSQSVADLISINDVYFEAFPYEYTYNDIPVNTIEYRKNLIIAEITNLGEEPLEEIEFDVSVSDKNGITNVTLRDDGVIDTLSPDKNLKALAEIQDVISASWTDQEIQVSITSINGNETSIDFSRKISVYGATNNQGDFFDIFVDSYSFPNPALNWRDWKEIWNDILIGQEELPISGLFFTAAQLRGRCYGMAITSSAYFLDPSTKPESVKNKATYNMDLYADDGVGEAIFTNHIAQIRDTLKTPLEPIATYSELADIIKGGESAILTMKGYPIESSKELIHTVTAYRILEEFNGEQEPQKAYVHLYDSNITDTVGIAVFDLKDNTFVYVDKAFTTYNEAPEVREAFYVKTNKQFFDSIAQWGKNLARDLWDSGLQLITVCSPVNVEITGTDGQRLTIQDDGNEINEIPGARIEVYVDGDGHRSVGYYIPLGAEYNLSIIGTDDGLMGLEFVRPESESQTTLVRYDDIQVNVGMTGLTRVGENVAQSLSLDYDGDGKYEKEIVPTSSSSSESRNLVAASLEVSPGDHTTIQLSVSDTVDIASAEIILEYDQDVLTIGDVRATDLLSGMNFLVNKNTPGKVGIFMAGANGLASGNGPIIEIDLTINSDAEVGTESKINIASDTAIFDELGESLAFEAQDGIIKIAKTCTKGDVNNDGRVRSNDATLALRIAAELMTANTQEACAADMNDDGKVRANDATLILREAAGLGAPAFFGPDTGIVSISLSKLYNISGKRVTVPVKIDNNSLLSSGDICLAYDSEVLEAVDVLTRNNLLIANNIAEPGIIRISFASIDGFEDEIVFSLVFDIASDDESTIELLSTDLYDYNGLPIEAKMINQKFISWLKPPESNALLQNYPNPFNPETWIPYQLQDDTNVTIKIHATTGQVVRTLNLGHRPAGFYTDKEQAAYWSGKNDRGEYVASGVYFYHIKAGDFSATRKMTVRK